ncbi:MAG TPA: tannase/feruloyl esterase family alpha/beta hydrolase [Candidatus Angelobacter sp.]|nr:tannase/feruloyl esterase family alpha/beta hydrolase [Candidatus Angelobacter sp.]
MDAYVTTTARLNSSSIPATIASRLVSFVFMAGILCVCSRQAVAATCESLSSLKLPDTTITLAQVVEAGAFTPSGAAANLPGAAASRYKELPAFCRVTATVKPTPDSDIKIEVWMPLSGWNGKFQGEGNGGFAGVIAYPALAGGLSLGYSTAGTDTGHAAAGTDASWALGHPEKVIDFGYRGIHEMTVKAKAIVRAFYGKDLQRSYFGSCSDGGREALMEAQRFPEDYDGILAGAPANYWTHLLMAGAWEAQALMKDPASYIPAAKIPALGAAVNAACDKQDGVADGVINDPRACHFDPSVLLCKGEDSNSCFTAPQVVALKKVYDGPTNSKGQPLYVGRVPGAEDGPGGWVTWITGSAPGKSLQYAFTTNFFKYMVFNNPDWDFKTFNFDSDLKTDDEKQARNVNSTDPNLKPFRARGGKLIIYHGWNDPAISPLNTINYYNSVLSTVGARESGDFLRLYLVPGMQHCGGGPGPNSFGQQAGSTADAQHNIYAALEQWVEKGIAPGTIVATKYVSDLNPQQGVKFSRPLCPYPQIIKYKGSGDTNDAANFACAQGKK